MATVNLVTTLRTLDYFSHLILGIISFGVCFEIWLILDQEDNVWIPIELSTGSSFQLLQEYM